MSNPLFAPDRPKRGNEECISDATQALAKELLGREFDRTDIRLMPYLMDRATNQDPIDRRRVDDEELRRLEEYDNLDLGDFLSPFKPLATSDAFWTLMCASLRDTYATKWREVGPGEVPGD